MSDSTAGHRPGDSDLTGSGSAAGLPPDGNAGDGEAGPKRPALPRTG